MPIYVPVAPELDAQGRLRVLVPLLGDCAKTFPEKPPVVDSTTGLDLTAKWYQTTMQAAAKLGLGGAFSVAAEGYCQVMVMDAVVGINRHRVGRIPEGIKILGTFWGFTLRVVMRVRSLKAETRLDLGYIAAAVEVGAAEVQYSVVAHGIDRKLFATALKEVPMFGRFDYTVFSRLSTALDQLKAELADRVTRAPLLPIGVYLDNDPFDADIRSAARSVRWTMKQIAAGICGSVALAGAPGWVSYSIAEQVYHELGQFDLDDDISDQAADKARTWLG